MNVDSYTQGGRPDPEWWYEPRMRDALSCRDVGQVFALLHRRHGMTQRRIAELAGFAASEVYEIMRGRQVMAYDVLVRVADGLGVPRGMMGLAYDVEASSDTAPQPRPLDDPKERRQFIAALAGFAVGGTPAIDAWLPQLSAWPGYVPEVVSAAAIATVRDITGRHRQLDAAYGGGSCRDSALGYLVWARCLLRSRCPSDALAAELRRELADLHNLVGWMCHDLGEHTEARRYLAQGLALAREAGDATRMADAYYRLGRVSIHQDDPSEALHLFQLGQIVATNADCLALVAILHANIGWAHAKMGNAAAVRDSLARAVDELGRADTATAPRWTRFFCEPADLDGMAGLVYASLARRDERPQVYARLAIEHASRALQLRTETSRSGTLDHITVAMGHALLGESEAVVPHAVGALSALGQVRSRRLLDRLRSVADVAAPQAAGDSELRDVIDKVRTLVAA